MAINEIALTQRPICVDCPRAILRNRNRIKNGPIGALGASIVTVILTPGFEFISPDPRPIDRRAMQPTEPPSPVARQKQGALRRRIFAGHCRQLAGEGLIGQINVKRGGIGHEQPDDRR